VKFFFVFYKQCVIKMFKNSFFHSVTVEELSVKPKCLSFETILILYSHTHTFLSSFFFPSVVLLKNLHSFLQRYAWLKMRQLHPGSDQLHSVSLLLRLTPRYWIMGYRRFGINLHTHHHGTKYSLIFQPLGMKILGCIETSNADYQVTRLGLAQ